VIQSNKKLKTGAAAKDIVDKALDCFQAVETLKIK